MQRLTTLVAACLLASAAAAAAQTPVKIGHTALTDNVADFVAIEKGFFAKHGIAAEAVSLRNGAVIVPSIVSGEIQIGTLTAPTFVQALDGGLELQVATFLTLTTDGDKSSGLVVGENSGLDSVDDLAGKSLGGGSIGSMINVATLEWLRQNGVAFERVKVVESPMPQLADLVRNGNIDFTVLPEPLLSRALAGGGVKQIANPIGALPPGKAVMLNVVSKTWAQENPQAIAGIKAAVAEASAWTRENPDEALAIVSKYLGIAPDIVRKSGFPRVESATDVAGLAWWAEAMTAQGLLRSDVDFTGAILP